MGTLPRETIVDVPEGRLREDVLTGRHPAGSCLTPERAPADGHGVTRTTLGHAFGRPVRAGRPETRHGVGTRLGDFARFWGADRCPCAGATTRAGCVGSSKCTAEWVR
ncbi:hypothetical protein AB0J25_30325 [Streptomyces sp. NPDC049910]|uniref:hypothetical protein n=1 Tax=Streptomyces sp. NPDC049910 TaxID=3155278 RepID=UPI0034341327